MQIGFVGPRRRIQLTSGGMDMVGVPNPTCGLGNWRWVRSNHPNDRPNGIRRMRPENDPATGGGVVRIHAGRNMHRRHRWKTVESRRGAARRTARVSIKRAAWCRLRAFALPISTIISHGPSPTATGALVLVPRGRLGIGNPLQSPAHAAVRWRRGRSLTIVFPTLRSEFPPQRETPTEPPTYGFGEARRWRRLLTDAQ